MFGRTRRLPGRGYRALRLATIAAVVLGTRLAAAAPYGVCAHVPEPALLRVIAEAGISWVRIDIYWSAVEPQQNRFDWSAIDVVVRESERLGLDLFATISSTPAWATDGEPGAGVPRDPADWYDVCYRAASRYRGSIDHWGMWNEPNRTRFWSGNRREYVDVILRPGSAAVHAASPTARVCGPELAHLQSARWDDWLRGILEDAASSLDIVTHHVYPDGFSPNSVADKLVSQPYPWDPPSVRKVLQDTGWWGRPFWLSEVGVDTRTSSNGELLQFYFVDGILEKFFGPQRNIAWVDRLFIYEATDGASPTADFGLTGPGPEFRRKPGFDAYRDFVARTAIDDAAVVAASVPAALLPEATAEAVVTFLNTGTTTWTSAAGYRLGSPGDSDPFAAARHDLGAGTEVSPGATASFEITLQAPAEVSPWPTPLLTDWRMLREGVAWFGEPVRRTVAIAAEPSPILQLVPAVASTDGLKGSHWSTALTLHNPGPGAASARITVLEQGRDNSFPRAVTVELPYFATRSFTDVLGQLFGFSGTASLAIETDRDIVVSGRTFTNSSQGSRGHAVVGTAVDHPPRSGRDHVLLGLRHSDNREDGFRTNLGLVNQTREPVDVEVELLGDGVHLGTVAYRLEPRGFMQVTDVFRAVTSKDVEAGLALVHAEGIVAYAVVTDNRTADPEMVTEAIVTDEPMVVTAAAHTQGLNGTVWRTDLALFNPGPADRVVGIGRLGSGAPSDPVEVTLPSRSLATIPDAFRSLFGLSGSGALTILPRDGPVAASARTYNETPAGTFGHHVAALHESSAAPHHTTLRLVGLTSSVTADGGSRTNIGIVNVGMAAARIEVLLFDGARLVGRREASVGARRWVLLKDIFADVGTDPVATGSVTVRTTSEGARLLAYASVVDNASGDASHLPAQ